MPLKSRAGRSSTKINKPDLQNGTAAFLKTDKKFEFYWVDSNNQPKEITPIEAFKIFEANQNHFNNYDTTNNIAFLNYIDPP
ncbi:MAG TPA: hypothetical protein DCQ51_13300 [Planktothrix sp. UBA8407]|nr:hypothetical protein [Planktothrix sp. UBA8407]